MIVPKPSGWQNRRELNNYTNPEALYTLSAPYAEIGRFSEAVQISQNAIELYL